MVLTQRLCFPKFMVRATNENNCTLELSSTLTFYSIHHLSSAKIISSEVCVYLLPPIIHTEEAWEAPIKIKPLTLAAC